MISHSKALLEIDDEEVVRLAFDNFNPERVKYFRSMIQDHWINRPATMDELMHLLPEDSRSNQGLIEALQMFKIKTLVANRRIFLVNQLNDVLGVTVQKTAEETSLVRLELLCQAKFRDLLTMLLKERKIYGDLVKIPTFGGRRALMDSMSPDQYPISEDELAIAIKAYKKSE